MAGPIDTEASPRTRPRDVELNVVPFIDLMTVLTAFLLVTAVWSNTAAVSVERGGHGTIADDFEEHQRLSVLVTPDELWVGSSQLDARRLDSFAELEQALARYKATSSFADVTSHGHDPRILTIMTPVRSEERLA